MAPGAAIGYDFYLIGAATAAGAAMGLVSVIGALLVLAAAYTVAQFANRLPSAGGFYAYISHGLGLKTGTWSGLVFFMYSLFLPAEVTLIWAGLTQSIVNQYLHVNISWIFWEILMVSIITALAYFGIKRSARVAMVTSSLEIAVFTVLGIACLVHPTSPVNLAVVLAEECPRRLVGHPGLRSRLHDPELRRLRGRRADRRRDREPASQHWPFSDDGGDHGQYPLHVHVLCGSARLGYP